MQSFWKTSTYLVHCRCFAITQNKTVTTKPSRLPTGTDLAVTALFWVTARHQQWTSRWMSSKIFAFISWCIMNLCKQCQVLRKRSSTHRPFFKCLHVHHFQWPWPHRKTYMEDGQGLKLACCCHLHPCGAVAGILLGDQTIIIPNLIQISEKIF
jgi:hypothetical protein